MDRYRVIDRSTWTGRVDSDTDTRQFRMHQVVRSIDLQVRQELEPGFSLLGYACDEGVRRNKGKMGAKEGPAAFRQAFCNLASHDIQQISDLGDIICPDDQLEGTQEALSEAVAYALSCRQKLIVIGGGHDLAYGHYHGIRKALGPTSKIGIINFDAHFDLREITKKPSSGTPFWQIANEENEIHYACVGIQRSANTTRLYDTADELKVLVIERDDVASSAALDSLVRFIEEVDQLYLTIDLDGFDMAISPGVSAPTVNGFTYIEVVPYLKKIWASKKLISMDIAELNPSFDTDQQSTKLAAYLAYAMITNWS